MRRDPQYILRATVGLFGRSEN
jgi:hypothetical protein